MILHSELRSLLARIRRRWFVLTLLATGGRAAAVASIPLLAAGLIGWVLTTSTTAAVALSSLAALAALTGVAFVLLRMQRRPNDARVARFVEEQTGSDDLARARCEADALVSAVQVAEAPDQYPGRFAAIIVDKAVAALRAIAPSSVISTAALRRAGLEAAAGSAVLLLALAIAQPMLLRAAAATWIALNPESIQIAVLTGDARVKAGQPLQIAATVSGRAAKLLGVVPSLVVSADNQQRTVAMRQSGDRFVHGFEAVDRSFKYKVAAGAAASASYSVTALFPPRVTRIDVRYTYPSFTRLAPYQDDDAGDIHGPAGTTVRLSIQSDKAIADGELTLTSGRPIALASAGTTTATADLVLARDDAYRVKLRDRDGLTSAGDVEYFIRLMDDRPPDIRIVRPGADQGITPLEEVAIEARADDDYGVASMELVYTVAGREPRTVPFARVAGTDLARTGSFMLPAEELRVQPGDVITYYAKARDVARGKRSTETRSEIFFLEVKPFNEEFVSAQSQAGGAGATGGQIDGLIAAQKEIINATWNLERRASAGRSADDLKAVGQAQAELKGRLETMLTGGRGRSRGLFPPQQIAPSSPQGATRGSARPDPVGAAVDAMGKAVEQLHNERTAEAIPHEMAALQGLLQAQAEVRRREVMQQSASAAGQGGTSRSDRDLSALFDRELQRQQRTNYESPQPQSENTEDRSSASDALDRVRDLARRQEDLSRRLRDVANGKVSPDEVKRQLERLAREQEELRRQAEEIEKQLGQGAASSGARGRTAGRQNGRGSERSDQMRRAAQEMQAAANDMQQQNAADAAATGEKAARALRETERQIGGTTNARQRAAGELQLEAQQIADGQRRVASEAARLARDGSGAAGRNDDARRRLAGEKESLADRVDELQRRARQLERELPGASGAPMREAANQLERQRIGERMRSSAKEMRGAGTGREGAGDGQGTRAADRGAVEQQLSRALDSVVDALGGNAQDGARRLTSELDRTREMRDRLERLQRQVGEAEKAAAGRQAASRGQQGGAGGGDTPEQLRRAREEYARELQRTRESLERMQEGRPGGPGGTTPEHHEYSRSAPGNEAFKQDFEGWDALRKDVDAAIERYEASVAARLNRKTSDDRLNGGASDRVPEAYRERVSRYFESIAGTRK